MRLLDLVVAKTMFLILIKNLERSKNKKPNSKQGKNPKTKPKKPHHKKTPKHLTIIIS